MRILHITQATESSGLVNVVLNVLPDQVERGWDVHLACPDDGGELFDAAAAMAGVRVHDWKSVRSPIRGVLRETRALSPLVESINPDVVHLHSSKAGLIGRLAIRGRRPTVFQPHAWSFEAVGGGLRFAATAWERFATRWTAGTLCVSEGEALAGRAKGTLARRVTTVYNGVDMDHWAPADRLKARARLGIDADVPVVVCVGRLVPQKGQDVAVAAWTKVRARVPGSVLYLIGRGPDHSSLERAAVPGVRLVGLANPRDWYTAADLVLVPSRWEGMPLVILEAMASARPVVSTDVAGAHESLGAHGSVVPVDDAEALAAAVIDALLDLDASETRGLALRARAQELFDVAASCAGIAAFDESCVASPRPRHVPIP